MTFELPALPFSRTALEPHISAETLNYHYDKHHAGYVKKLNKALESHELHDCDSLEHIICNSDGEVYDLAAQIWNHNFYWECMSPDGGGSPDVETTQMLGAAFGSVESFTDQFKAAALNQFGSGWAWLSRAPDGALTIESTTGAGNPLSSGSRPILTLDVWEHAYYLDFKNARGNYVDTFMSSLINWSFVGNNLRN